MAYEGSSDEIDLPAAKVCQNNVLGMYINTYSTNVTIINSHGKHTNTGTRMHRIQYIKQCIDW